MNCDRNSSRRFCSYTNCTSDRLKTRNGAISFFSFPVRNTERCSEWITNSGREEFRFLTPRELAEKKICELHFDRGMFSNEFKTNLTKRAVPTDWRMVTTELIQIDDDEVNIENNTVPEIANNLINASMNGHSNNDDDDENPNSIALENVSNDPMLEERSVQESLVGFTSADKQSTGVDGVHKSITDKFSSKRGSANNKNTKFHNLPPQTTQADFYYPSVEETNSFSEPPNNSFHEPTEGGLPLFVQQNSVLSLHDEGANSDMSEPVSKKRRQNRDNDDLADQMRDAMKHLKNITALLTSNEDEFELFGKSVAVQLKKMSLCTALTVQAKIQNMLSQYRINDIKKNTNEKSVEHNDVEENESTEVAEDPLTSPQHTVIGTPDLSDTETN